MTARRALLALAAGVALAPGGATAQERPAAIDTAGIHTTLRAFYFNLAHQDWEAIAGEVLSAKVVAHRPMPADMVAAAVPRRGSGGVCASDARVVIEAAIMRRDRDWVEISVPRCNTVTPGADEFRLIRFDRRWRFVSIALFEERASFSAER